MRKKNKFYEVLPCISHVFGGAAGYLIASDFVATAPVAVALILSFLAFELYRLEEDSEN